MRLLSVSSPNLTCTSKDVHVPFLTVQITTCPSAPIPVQWTCRVSAINTPEASSSTAPSFKPSSNTNPHPWYTLAACFYFRVMHKPFALLAFVLSPAQCVSWGFLTLLILIPTTTWTLVLDPRQRRCLPQHLWCSSQRGFLISEIETMPKDRQEP